MTTGQKLQALRKSFDLSVVDLSRLAGIVRQTISRAEEDEVKWQGAGIKEGLMRAYGLSYEQLNEFLFAGMSVDEAHRIASPTVDAARRAAGARDRRDRRLQEVLRRVASQHEIADATRSAAAMLLEQLDEETPTNEVVRQVIAMDGAIREQVNKALRLLRGSGSQ